MTARMTDRLNHHPAFRQVDAHTNGQMRNDSLAQPAGEQRRLYLTARQLETLTKALSERDHAVLDSTDRIRVATGRQLARLHQDQLSDRQWRRHLQQLSDLRLLTRLDRTIGGVHAGSSGYIYALDVAGQRLLHPDVSARHPTTPGLAFLDHGLAITELYVLLREAERRGRVDLLDFVTEPNVWRSFVGRGGQRTRLKPDAEAVLGVGQYEDHFFIEVDRGTVGTRRLSEQMHTYVQFWQTGREQQRSGLFPRVLYLVPNQRRLKVVVDVASALPAETWQLFQVGEFADAMQFLISKPP